MREIAAAKLEEYGVSREQFDCLDLGRNIAVTAGAKAAIEAAGGSVE